MNPLESAEAELDILTAQRDALDQKIDGLKKAIKILGPVYRPLANENQTLSLAQILAGEDLDTMGLTSAIEKFLRGRQGFPITPTGVRDALVEGGYKLSGDNPMASIHQVLKRLVARPGGEFIAQEIAGQTVYSHTSAQQQRNLLGIRAASRNNPGGAPPKSGRNSD